MDIGTFVGLGLLALLIGFGFIVANNVAKTDLEQQREQSARNRRHSV
jgi:hypothetical protein